MIFIKNIQQRTDGSSTNFFWPFFFIEPQLYTKTGYTPKFENWQVSGYIVYW